MKHSGHHEVKHHRLQPCHGLYVSRHPSTSGTSSRQDIAMQCAFKKLATPCECEVKTGRNRPVSCLFVYHFTNWNACTTKRLRHHGLLSVLLRWNECTIRVWVPQSKSERKQCPCECVGKCVNLQSENDRIREQLWQ